jgi:hypothetical protein
MTTGGIVVSRIAADKDKQKPKNETEEQKKARELAEAARKHTGNDDRPKWQKDLGLEEEKKA